MNDRRNEIKVSQQGDFLLSELLSDKDHAYKGNRYSKTNLMIIIYV